MSDKDDGTKFINAYWDGIKFVIKFVDADAITIKIKTKFVINRLSILPIISVGLVKILDKFSGSSFKKISTPVTINKAKNEKIIKFKIKLKFPFFISFSFFTYLAKSPKVKITIEKYANTVPITVKSGSILFGLIKLFRSRISMKAFEEIFTSLKRTEKKNNAIPR